MRIRHIIIGAAAVLALPSAATAANVKLALNYDRSAISAGLKMPDGKYAVRVPYSGLKFEAGAANDAGYAVLKPTGASAHATIDLIARTADGVERVVDSQIIWDTQYVSFDMQYPEENTTYVARLNPSAEGGVAAATDSNPIVVPTYVRNYPATAYSRYTGWLRFDGFFARGVTANLNRSVRVLIQKRSGSSWRTLRTLAPDAGKNWVGRVNVGRARTAVYRVRTVPIGPARRYIAVTDYRFCIAPTVAQQRRLCAGVGWVPRY